MAKLFAIVSIVGGVPDTGLLQIGTDYKGFVLSDQVGGFGAYLFSGTAAQLLVLNALPSVLGIVGVTEDSVVKWAELDGIITAPVRTKLNVWLVNRGYPTIPLGWSYRQVINTVYQRINAKFDLSVFDITE